MKVRSGFTAFLAVSLGVLTLLSGCVSSKEHKARLAELEGYKKDVAGLEQEAASLRAERDELEKELSGLRERHEKIKEERRALSEDNELLRKRESGLAQELVAIDLRVRGLEEELSRCQDSVEELNSALSARDQEMDALKEEKQEAIAGLKGAYDDLMEELKTEIKQGEIEIIRLRNRLSVSMVESILFDSGSAEIKPAGTRVLDRVAAILKRVPDKDIRVEGHTDNVPIGPRIRERFPTNWELSTARATNVVRYLQDKGGIEPSRLVAAGYSMYRAVATNETPEGKAKNRRIEIVLTPPDAERPAGGGPH
jgi:chemotaxis protein MotB